MSVRCNRRWNQKKRSEQSLAKETTLAPTVARYRSFSLVFGYFPSLIGVLQRCATVVWLFPENTTAVVVEPPSTEIITLDLRHHGWSGLWHSSRATGHVGVGIAAAGHRRAT